MVAGTVGAVGVEGADWDIRFGAHLQRNLEKKNTPCPFLRDGEAGGGQSTVGLPDG